MLRTWSDLTMRERAVFFDRLRYGHLLEKQERDYLYELEVTVWLRPLNSDELRCADEIISFVKGLPGAAQIAA